MTHWLRLIGLSGLAAGLAYDPLGTAHSGRAVEQPAGPVVIELFTSEGCSSCPPADEWLRRVTESRAVDGVPVIPLSEHVDYWNRLGWNDPFSSAAMTARQQRYARSLSAEVYTPQMVVDGGVEFVGSDQRVATAAIRAAATAPKASITADLRRVDGTFDVSATVAPGTLGQLPDGDVLVAVTEDGLVSNVAAGENQGRRIAHAAVARYLEKVGTVKKRSEPAAIRARVPIDPSWSLKNVRLIVLVQSRDHGKIVGVWSGPAPLDTEARLEGR